METISWEDFSDKYFGKVGTYRRYRHDRATLKIHIRDTFLDFLLWPLHFLPWGHVAVTFWFLFLTESKHSALDGMAFAYINDAYVVGFRDALKGSRHNWEVSMEPHALRPYRGRPRYPLWLLTRIVIPQFKAIYKARKENFV